MKSDEWPDDGQPTTGEQQIGDGEKMPKGGQPPPDGEIGGLDAEGPRNVDPGEAID